MPRKNHLALADATEEQIAEMIDGSAQETVETTDEELGSGKEETKPPKEFKHAPSVESLGKLLIKQNYPALSHQRILYVFVSEASKSEGQPVIMKPMKIQGLNAWLAQLWDGAGEFLEGPGDPFFLVLVSESHWLTMGMDDKTALLDETLWQFNVRETGALALRKPEIRTSVDVINRRGFYTNRLKDLAIVGKKHIAQAELSFVEEAV